MVVCSDIGVAQAKVVAGRYRLVEVLGEGAMGAVWRAVDERMRREVALKQLKLPAGFDTGMRDRLAARMEREARAAGRLRHPNIVTVHDQIDDDGLPWIVMELVGGSSLASVLAARGPLPEAEAARIGAGIASALDAAHRAGIVHRDIKPGNVLLEGDRVVVTDFGIAAVADEATLTATGALMGTLAYMAPEQVNGREASAASDMWSLGATLYAAVEGRPAFTGNNNAALLHAVARGIPAPSVLARALKPLLDGLLSVDPGRRPSAAEVVEVLSGATASPTTVTPAHRPPRLLTRRKAAGLGAAAVLAAVPAVLALRRGDKDPGKAPQPVPSSGEPVPTPRDWTRAGPAGLPLTGPDGTVISVAFSPDGALVAAADNAGSVRLWKAADRTPAGRVLTEDAGFLAVAFSPDGGLLAAGAADGVVWLRDMATGARSRLRGHRERVWSVAFGPDGTLASASQDGTVRLWDVRARAPIGRVLDGHGASVYSVVFGNDGRILATGSDDETALLWDVAAQAPAGKPFGGHAGAVYSVDLTPDGKVLATGGQDGTVRFWDAATRAPLGGPLSEHSDKVLNVGFAPDGRVLATGSSDGTIRLWDTQARAPLGDPLRAHQEGVESVAFDPGGRILASGGGDHTVRLWKS